MANPVLDFIYCQYKFINSNLRVTIIYNSRYSLYWVLITDTTTTQYKVINSNTS
jgi:hypothetical protein